MSAAGVERGLTPCYAAVAGHCAAAEVHCYTPAEYERKRDSLKAVRDAAEHGLELVAVA